MKSWYVRIVLFLLIGLTAGCVSSIFAPSSVTFSASEMQAALARKAPFEKDYLKMVDLTLTQPVVNLNPEKQRIILQFDVSVMAFGYSRKATGHISVSSELAYDPADKTIVLKNPQLENEQLSGVPDTLGAVINQMTAVAIHDHLDGATVYRFTPEQLQILGMHVEPENIEITESSVVLHLKHG